MIRSLIVDDEPRAIRGLQILIDQYCPEILLIGSANNINEAYKLIIKEKPDLVFLDINMPNGSGIDLLNRINRTTQTKVIFTTAYDEFAITAIRLSAIDYLLKPVDKHELIEAVDRFKNTSQIREQFDIFSEILDQKRTDRFSISTIDGIRVVKYSDVNFLSSEKNYTRFHLVGSTLITSKPLGEYEKLLDQQKFVRVHRSHLINIEKIIEFDKKKGNVILENGDVVEVSRNRKEFLIDKLQNL
ncbi:LytTR family DNA-binding domain-containing protein [Ekhidna sp.]|jgi:two-component system LytT family response regulator|uniref:LytR/AlgR family response regulator transcription factor n=1 Tax=Ekhidna sp. TaxID=2608089 RepID=UPI0032EE092B